ncbi:MAG TPA: hypothetical protein VNT42_08920 [Sphingomonas sp.]|nr:hypothetical protein [Sphingomonas sp.]
MNAGVGKSQARYALRRVPPDFERNSRAHRMSQECRAIRHSVQRIIRHRFDAIGLTVKTIDDPSPKVLDLGHEHASVANQAGEDDERFVAHNGILSHHIYECFIYTNVEVAARDLQPGGEDTQ